MYPAATRELHQLSKLPSPPQPKNLKPPSARKDFVREWLWTRSDQVSNASTDNVTSGPHSLPGVCTQADSPTPAVAGTASSSLPGGASLRTLPSSRGGVYPASLMDPTNLDYVLNKLETRSRCGEQRSTFGQSDYGGGSLYSQRSLLHPYTKKRCVWNGYCKAFVVIIIVLLLAWGVAVPLYFTVGPGTLPWQKHSGVATDVAEAQVSSAAGKESQLHNKVKTAVNCSLQIVNQRYNSRLRNSYSAEFQHLKRKIETLIAVVFHKDKNFDKAVVASFRPGSVIAEFVVMYTAHQNDIKEYTRNVLTNHIMSHWTMLGTYQIGLNSINVQYILDKCALRNGGCSHICFWTLFNEGFKCHCPAGYILMSDHKTCHPNLMRSTTTMASNPCGPDHFMCNKGNCIPDQWLCDGVSDCILADDEASNMCRALRRGNNQGMSPERGSPYANNMPTPQALQQQQLQFPYAARNQLDVKPATTPAPPPQPQPEETTTSPHTTPFIIWHKSKTTLEDFTIPGLMSEENGSLLGSNSKVKVPKLSRRSKFFG